MLLNLYVVERLCYIKMYVRIHRRMYIMCACMYLCISTYVHVCIYNSTMQSADCVELTFGRQTFLTRRSSLSLFSETKLILIMAQVEW